MDIGAVVDLFREAIGTVVVAGAGAVAVTVVVVPAIAVQEAVKLSSSGSSPLLLGGG